MVNDVDVMTGVGWCCFGHARAHVRASQAPTCFICAEGFALDRECRAELTRHYTFRLGMHLLFYGGTQIKLLHNRSVESILEDLSIRVTILQHSIKFER